MFDWWVKIIMLLFLFRALKESVAVQEPQGRKEIR